jgi:hypothetical protein
MHQKIQRSSLFILCLATGAGLLPGLPCVGAEITSDIPPPPVRAESPPRPEPATHGRRVIGNGAGASTLGFPALG